MKTIPPALLTLMAALCLAAPDGAFAADPSVPDPSFVDQVGQVRAWLGTVSITEIGELDAADANESGKAKSSIAIAHRCSVQVLVRADPEEAPPVSRWDGNDLMSCSIDDHASADVWDVDGRHVGHDISHTTADATSEVATQLTLDTGTGTYSLHPGDPYVDATTVATSNGYESTTTESTAVYNHWTTMPIEDQALGGLSLAGSITNDAPYLPRIGLTTGPPISTVITWSVAPMGWLPPDGCDAAADAANDASETLVPIMLDPSIRSGLQGERPEALRQAIAGALSSAGHPATPSMVNIGGTDDPQAGLMTFQVRLGREAKPLPTLDCIGRAIDAGQVPEGSVEGAPVLLIGALQTSGDQSRLTARTVAVETGDITSAGTGTVNGTDAAAMSAAAETAIARLDLMSGQ